MTEIAPATQNAEYQAEVHRELGRLVADSRSLIVFDWDVITGALRFNEAGGIRFGISPDKSYSMAEFLDLVDRSDSGRLENNLNRLVAGETDEIEPFRFNLADGNQVTIEGRGAVVVDPDGHRHIVGLQIDRTEESRQRSAEALSAAEKAHQIKNILGVISGMAAMSQRTPASSSEFVSSFNNRLQVLARCADLVATSNTGYLPITVFVSSIAAASAGTGKIDVRSCGYGIDIDACQLLAIAVHELTANALQYGALSVIEGEVAVRFEPESDGSLRFEWLEKSPSFIKPDELRNGFGWQILTRAIAQEFHTEPLISWTSEGLDYRFTISPDRLLRFGGRDPDAP